MEEKWKNILEESIQGLRFGSIEIVVHDGRITQIERRERFRTYQENGGPQEPNSSFADRKSGSVSRRT